MGAQGEVGGGQSLRQARPEALRASVCAPDVLALRAASILAAASAQRPRAPLRRTRRRVQPMVLSKLLAQGAANEVSRASAQDAWPRVHTLRLKPQSDQTWGIIREHAKVLKQWLCTSWEHVLTLCRCGWLFAALWSRPKRFAGTFVLDRGLARGKIANQTVFETSGL